MPPKRDPWNGQDYYVVLGYPEPDLPRWRVACDYGYLSAGHGTRY